MEGLAEEGDEPEPPGTTGTELTRRLLALAPALEAADREAEPRETEAERRWREERCGESIE